MPQREVDDGQIVRQRWALDRRGQGAAPFLAYQPQRASQHVQQALVVGRNLRLRLRREPLPLIAVFHRGGIACLFAAVAEAERRRQRRDEARLFLGRFAGLAACARLRQLEDAAGGQTAELMGELRAEIDLGIGCRAVGAFLLQAAGNDEAGLLGRAGLDQRYGTGLLDAVDIGLRQGLAHLLVEITQARHEHDRGRHAVGDLDQVARGFREALLEVVEEAQVLDLVDAEHERGVVHAPHQPAE